jgi:6,7-dimethyl-8-ribityllumazine synthase
MAVMSSSNARTLVGIVHSTWLPDFAARLVTRCRTDLAEDGIDVVTTQVPGAFTLAHGVRKLGRVLI